MRGSDGRQQCATGRWEWWGSHTIGTGPGTENGERERHRVREQNLLTAMMSPPP